MKFIVCKTRKAFIEAAGFDWYKIVKVDGGYIGFNSAVEYKTWAKTK